MSRSDARATRLECPTEECPGKLEVRTDRDPVAVRCPRCHFEESAEVYAKAAQARIVVATPASRIRVRGA